MKPEVLRITQISPDQSVIYITGSENLPDDLMLTSAEKEYAGKLLSDKEEYIFINSYYKCTYIVRMKDDNDLNNVREELRKTACILSKLIRSNNHSSLVISSDGKYREAVLDFAEGLILSAYSFDKYRTVEENNARIRKKLPSQLFLHGMFSDAGMKWLIDLTDAVYFARDMINEPVNHLNTQALAGEIKRLASLSGFKVEVLNKGKIEALKMGGLLAVNKGSVDPPAFCILEWKPENHVNIQPVVLVGKGIVYDTGGLNIKTGEYMAQMKTDMAGAAAVAAVLYTIAKTGIPLHVIGLIPATDNRPGGNAYTQGDILTMFNRMTVEVGNTDAEGRLILADAISYAGSYSPELIIDIATLTGSAAMTFGNQAIALMGNAGAKYISLMEESGYKVYERVARLPLWEEYKEQIKSDVADLKNIGGKEAGAITAGKFLESFTKFPFIHLDIAGTAMLKKDDYYRTREGTGSGVRLLSTFLKNLASTYTVK
jgi:leucyl aminopeptidase